MVAKRTARWVSPAEYLARERQAETRSEYIDGCIVAMAGAGKNHVRIATDVVIALGRQLEGTACEVFAMDLRVRIPATREYRYPDVAVVCGEAAFEDEQSDTLLNPTLIIEVLSPSTEAEDRGKKAAGYRSIPSVQVHVLIAQDEPAVECYERTENGWVLREYHGLDAVAALPAIGCTLSLRDVYRRVPFQ